MKILVRSDEHCCPFSSIVRGFGKKYPLRLEKLIDSINWSERLAEQHGCRLIVDCGDFFDKPIISAQEVSAIKDIQWSNIHKIFICGNHEMASHDSFFSSAKFFDSVDNCETVSEAKFYNIDSEELSLCFLPYIVETEKKPIHDYFNGLNRRRIVFSHNDLDGYFVNGIQQHSGFTKSEIDDFCDLFINGHIHVPGNYGNRIINVGSLLSQNFSHLATSGGNRAIIIDTSTMQVQQFENPYSFHFYKLDNNIDDLKDNSVVTLQCSSEEFDKFKNQLDSLKSNGKVIDYRIIINHKDDSDIEDDTDKVELKSTDHLQRFIEFVHQNIGDSNLINDELSKIIS